MPSPVARQAILLSGTAVKPVWQANFLTASSLPAGLTYTKSGSIPATLFDSTGKLTFQGNNLKTYSNTFTDASWTKGSTTISNANAVADPFGGTQASTITATGAYGYLQGLYSSTTGYNAISSIWVRLRSGNGAINLYNTNGTGAVAKTATSNWQQIYVSGTSGGVYTYLKMEIPNNGDVFDIYQGGISLVTYETTPRSVDQQITTSSIYLAPRLDTNPATLSPAGMLVEQASSGNYAKYSQDFSQSAWGKYTSGAATGSISANSVTDPASTTTGAYISINRAAASEYAEYYQSFTGTAASWTGSFFLKAHAGGDVGKTVSIAAYNGSTVVAGTTVTLTASWVRYSVTGTMAASGSCNFAIGYVASTDYAGAPTQTGAVGFDVAFGQFDNTSFPLSYIPNPTSSTVTRTADVVTPTTYASKASIWQRLSESAGTTARTYYAPGALPSPFPTGYWYQSMAAYPRALTTAEQTPRLVVGAPY